MHNYKQEILNEIGFTELVYERLHKKLHVPLSKENIEAMVVRIIRETKESGYKKIGKNIYITSNDNTIRLTINYSTKRIITADRLT